MLYVPRGLMKSFSEGFLISVSLPATDLECLTINLIFNSLKFKKIAFKQCPPFLAIPVIWNHLEEAQCNNFTGGSVAFWKGKESESGLGQIAISRMFPAVTYLKQIDKFE